MHSDNKATLSRTCDSYIYKGESDGWQRPMCLVSVCSHVYDRGRGRMEKGGGGCMVRRILHSAAHGVQSGANFGVVDNAGCLMCWQVRHK